MGVRGGGTGKSDTGAEERELRGVSWYTNGNLWGKNGALPGILSLIRITHAILQQM